MEKHKKEECPRRLHKCPHRQEAGEYQEMTTTHLDECAMKEVPCPNQGCNEHIARRNLSEHHQTCMFEKIPCKYAIIGCKEEVLRKDLEEHVGDTQQHLQLAVDTTHQQQIMITQQKLTIKEQENMLAHLRSKEMPVTYKFVSYDQHKTANDEIYTPAFYTSPGGYKMCICVIANGEEESKDNGVSVYAYLMKGENDDHLPWPFTGTLTIELLNQLEDWNHYSTETIFPPDDEASQRVTNEEISTAGWGDEEYILHSELGYNAANNCQYLKDDCLYFRFSVNAKSSSKPWLTCV